MAFHKSQWINIAGVEIIHETPLAFLCLRGARKRWVPKSQLRQPQNLWRGFRGPIAVSSWWFDNCDGRSWVDDETEEDEEEQQPYRKPPSNMAILPTANRVYRQLAAKYHPDRSPETADTMKDLNQLWQAVQHDCRGGKG